MDANAKQQINELLARSAYYLDQKDLPNLKACFRDDAAFRLQIAGVEGVQEFVGIDAIMGLMSGALETQTDERKHVVSNVWYQAEGDREATVVSYLTLAATENGATNVITTGIYTDTVAADDEGWLITDRNLFLDGAF